MKHVSNSFTLYICIASLLSLCEFLSARADSYASDLDNVFRSHRTSNIRPLDCKKLVKQIKCLGKKIDTCCNQPTCNNAITFGSAEINQLGGYVIKQPGHYCLKEDVVFNPSPSPFTPPNPATVQAAITIEASDVFLDLGSHTLSQFGAGTSTQVPYCVGILIPDLIPFSPDKSALATGGLQSIYINGSGPAIIEGFSMFGVRVFAHTYDIQLRDFTVKNTGALASKALRPFPSYIPHATGAQNTAFGTNDAISIAGISIGETTFFEGGLGPVFFTQLPDPQNNASDVVLENISCLNNFYLGLFVTNTSNVTVASCHLNDNWSDQPGFTLNAVIFGARTPHGANIQFIDNLRVSDSTFNRTQMRGDFVTPLGGGSMAGARSRDSIGTVWTNCQFNESSNTFFSTAFSDYCAGYISAGNIGVTMINCSFEGTRSIAAAEGFHTSRGNTNNAGSDLYLLNCTARNIQQIGNQAINPTVATRLQACGFEIDFGRNFVLENCVASDITVNGPLDQAGFVAGFYSADNIPPALGQDFAENYIFKGCIAERALALNGGSSRGFAIGVLNSTSLANVHRSISLDSCIAEGNLVTDPLLWVAAEVYNIGAYVSNGGGFFTSLQNNNAGNVPPAVGTSNAFWRATTLLGTKSIGCGFYMEGNSSAASNNFPWSLRGCKALHNNGVAAVVVGPITQYSAGFYNLGAQRSSFFECEALNNNNGFFLQNSARNAIRSCRSDNNAIILTVTGQVLTMTIANGGTGYSVGDILTLSANGSGTAQAIVTAVSAGAITSVSIINSGFNYTTASNPVSTTGGNNSATLNITSVSNPTGSINALTINNPGSGYAPLDQVTINGGSGPATVRIDSVTGLGGVMGFTVLNPGFNYPITLPSAPAITTTTIGGGSGLTFNITSVIVGEGYTDVGTGTQSAPTVSTSTWQTNTAFANGANVYDGPNGNYNVVVAAGPIYVPELQIKQSDPLGVTSYVYVNPVKTTQAHNISTIS